MTDINMRSTTIGDTFYGPGKNEKNIEIDLKRSLLVKNEHLYNNFDLVE